MSNDELALRHLNRLKKGEIKVIDRERVVASVKKTIFGQDDTIDLIVEQVRNGFAANPKRREGPIGVFMLMGPAGTGKTSLARALAAALFESNDGFTMVDMNSCRDEHAAWTYFGSPQGYAGGRGLLTSAIASRKGSGMLILLDEFEKASTTVHRMFLNAWATGFIVDNREGTQIDTRSTIWLLTTNALAEEAERAKRKSSNDRDAFNEEMREKLLEDPKTQNTIFTPEVLSRISEFFCLERLRFEGEEQQLMGLRLVRGIMIRLAQEYNLTLSENDISDFAAARTLHMLDEDFKTSGIRALQRWIRRQLSTQLVDLALSAVERVEIDGGEREGPHLVARARAS